jgi:mono/diheme cytochrome c family protein
MVRILKVLGALVGVVALALGAGWTYFTTSAPTVLDQRFDHIHGNTDIPVPFPLTSTEIDALRAERTPDLAKVEAGAEQDDADGKPADPVDVLSGVDLDAIALERAVARGERIVRSRAGCEECHGVDGGGGVIVDAFPMGRWAAPNITLGRTEGKLTVAAWDLAVRHGIAADGTRSTMPSTDYAEYADRDLSDLIVYFESLPPVERELAPTAPGPVMAMLIVQGSFANSVEAIDHEQVKPILPPDPEISAAYGAYVGSACTGCHGPELSGGVIPGGDPSWPPAPNLTPHETGTQGWTFETFERALRQGKGSDGRTLHDSAMPWPVFKNLDELEMKALFAWIQAAKPKPIGGR